MPKKPARKSKASPSRTATPRAKASPTAKSSPPRASIKQTIRSRSSHGKQRAPVERPDFHATADLRATSDPLWKNLATFRRRLMAGEPHSRESWQSLLIDIRNGAHEVGLRPQLGSVPWIAASIGEAREGDPKGGWDREEDGWSKVILTAFGDSGRIELFDLLDGFADPGTPDSSFMRETAIEWAESWMNARERQLAAPASGAHSDGANKLVQHIEELKPTGERLQSPLDVALAPLTTTLAPLYAELDKIAIQYPKGYPVGSPTSVRVAALHEQINKTRDDFLKSHGYQGERPPIDTPSALRAEMETQLVIARMVRGVNRLRHPNDPDCTNEDIQSVVDYACTVAAEQGWSSFPCDGVGTATEKLTRIYLWCTSPKPQHETAQHAFTNPVEVAAASTAINTRSDYVLAKLRRRAMPIGGTTRKPVAELSDIIMCYPEKARSLRRWHKCLESES